MGLCGAVNRFCKLLLLLIPIKIYQLSTIPESGTKIKIYISAWVLAMVIVVITKIIKKNIQQTIFDIERIRQKSLSIIKQKNFATNLIKVSMSIFTQIISIGIIIIVLLVLNPITLFMYLSPIFFVFVFSLRYIKRDYTDILSAIFFMICIVVFIYVRQDNDINLSISVISCFLIRYILNDMSKFVIGIIDFDKYSKGVT